MAKQLAKCRSCGADIVWVKTEAQKLMPIDATSCEDGNFVLVEDINGFIVFSRKGPEGERDGPYYKSHFATCPNSASHRKPKT